MQGLNTTPVHAHTALFGVYGLLSLGLVLIIARKLSGVRAWKETQLKWAFWGMNVGLGLMVVLSLLPIGLAQTWASVEHGLWYARSADFLQLPALQALRWLRILGDTVSFTLADAAGVQRYSGRISGDTISGEVQLPGDGRPRPWQATRIKAGKMDISAADHGSMLAVVSGSLPKEQ